MGSGGREHALAWKLSQSPGLEALHAAPGNPGIANLGECHPVRAEDGEGLLSLCRELGVDLEFERLDLLPGNYLVDVGVYRGDWEFAYDFHWQAYSLKVVGAQSDKGVFRPPHRWEVLR